MPRPKMPDGLYVSVSQIKTWLKCPRQFELRYVRGVAPAFVPVNLAFGSAIHETLAAYYSEIKASGTPLHRNLLLDVFLVAWEKAHEGAVPLQADGDEDDPGQLIETGTSMLRAFYENAAKAPPFEVEAVEHGFTVPFHDPDTGEILDEQLVGSIDLIILEHGRRVVIEHKSAAKRWSGDQLRFDIQVSGYKFAAREAGLGEVGVRLQVITKTRNPTVQVADLERDHRDEEDFIRTAVGVLKAIDAGVSFPVRGWACRTCPYSAACR